MALSLIINNSGWGSIADKDLDIRWGNCSILAPTDTTDDRLGGIFRKYREDRRSDYPDFEEYSDLAYEPLIKWS